MGRDCDRKNRFAWDGTGTQIQKNGMGWDASLKNYHKGNKNLCLEMINPLSQDDLSFLIIVNTRY